jgi:hypothetical protein
LHERLAAALLKSNWFTVAQGLANLGSTATTINVVWYVLQDLLWWQAAACR